jgi:murein DD-endopeptidase MepM/ murein hydrolase activator NlpD
MGRRLGSLAGVLLLLAFLPASAMARRGHSGVAGLQVALRAKGLYGGDVDGWYGRGTRRGVRRLQRHRRLRADGIAGRRTLRALGRRGRPRLGARAIRPGAAGFDVAALQFLLSWQGFPLGSMDGGYGSHTGRGLRAFQHRAGIGADGIAGPRTLQAVRRRPPRSPLRLSRPVRHTGIGDRFGPRGSRFHSGVDFPAPHGWNVRAARRGRVRFRGWISGYGRTLIVAHGHGVRTLYAHLSAATVRRGERVGRGERIGRVGATGDATGPHLHFEVIVRGAKVNPLTALR